jgi:hypothetical protein
LPQSAPNTALKCAEAALVCVTTAHFLRSPARPQPNDRGVV